MCVEVLVQPSGEILQTTGELAAFLKAQGAPPLLGPADDTCLCPVDLEITAADAGYQQVQDPDHYPFGVVWRPVSGAPS